MEARYKECGSIQTTHLSNEQKNILRRKFSNIEIVFLLDGDKPGQDAQIDELQKLNLQMNKNQSNFVFSSLFFIDNREYKTMKKDPDSYFIEKDYDFFLNFITDIVDYRDYWVLECITEYKQNKKSIDDLYENIGKVLKYYNPSYYSVIQHFIKNERSKDLQKFNKYFQSDLDIQTYYLMNKLNAEDFYCKKLLSEMNTFMLNYKILHSNFLKLVKMVESKLDVDPDQTKVSFSRDNLRLYGNKRNRFLADFRNDKDKTVHIELDYVSYDLYIYFRFEKDLGKVNQRDAENFYDVVLFQNVESDTNFEKAIKFIQKLGDGSDE